MASPHPFFSALFILTLLQCPLPAISQSTTDSSLPASPTSAVLADYNFTYPIFPDHYGSGIQVSYKDTIDVSWVANGVQSAPVLQIICWTRNDSSSFIYSDNPSSYTHDLTTSSGPSDPSFPLLLAPYQKYSPCQLRLADPHDSSQSVTSVALFISQNTNASTPGVTWSADNQAPKVAVDAGVATAETGNAGMGRNGVVGGMWAVAGAVVAAASVLL